LWRLLVTITRRKVTAALRRQHAQKRGAGQVRGESFFHAGPAGSQGGDPPRGLDAVADRQLDPTVEALMQDACEGLLADLDDDVLRHVALRKLEGFTNEELARELGCAVTSVERKLARIRKIWSRLGPAPTE
jgi:DNA-directed RNA polymerase specialized sigma24 family protein